MSTDEAEQREVRAKLDALLDAMLEKMSDEAFGQYMVGAVAAVEACQRELERRATKGQPPGRA